MSDHGDTFGCDGCGKSYRWKAELAGKKVKCKCGQVMTVPEELGVAEPEPAVDDGMYDLADDGAAEKPAPESASPDGRCPECRSPLADGAVICIECGLNVKTGQKMGGAAAAGESGGESAAPALGGMLSKMKGSAGASTAAISTGDGADDKLWKAKQVLIPGVMLAFGLALSFLITKHIADEYGMSLGAAIIGKLIYIGIAVVMLTAASFLAASLLSTTFGNLGTAVLKLAAIYVLASGLIDLMYVVTGFGGLMLEVPILVICYYGLLTWLFDLDIQETGLVVGIFIAVYYISSFIIAASLYNMLT